MNAIGKLWRSLSTLSESILGLAAVVDATAAKLRQQLALEHVEEPRQVIDHAGEVEEPASNGRSRNRKASVAV